MKFLIGTFFSLSVFAWGNDELTIKKNYLGDGYNVENSYGQKQYEIRPNYLGDGYNINNNYGQRQYEIRNNYLNDSTVIRTVPNYAPSIGGDSLHYYGK